MVTGDDVSCHKGEPYTTFFKLTGCLDGDFTCDDGQCVRMEQRCDQLPDCDDESDEMVSAAQYEEINHVPGA